MIKFWVMVLLVISLQVSFGNASYGQTREAGPLSLPAFESQGTSYRSSPLLALALAKEEEDFLEEEPQPSIPDPLEPLNRVFFEFNDRLYFWLLKPVATGYKAVTPEPVRVGVRNFFYNLAFPIRFVNCVFQGKVESAGDEISRFVINSAIGLGGLLDIATNSCGIKKHDEDLGQTLGFYGLGPAFYINWPVLGPSSVRDTIGRIGDNFLDPVHYVDSTEYRFALYGFYTINETSLSIGDYESLKKAALDPYVALRDAFYQNRRSKIEE